VTEGVGVAAAIVPKLEIKPEVKVDKTQFVLTGFSQTAGIRIYAFEGVLDRQRSGYSVSVNLALIPVYGIRIQDLPLLCRELLEQRLEPEEPTDMVFTEDAMRLHAGRAAAARQEAEQRKKAPRRPINANPGAGWRTTSR
jgi:hypothetical protein